MTANELHELNKSHLEMLLAANRKREGEGDESVGFPLERLLAASEAYLASSTHPRVQHTNRKRQEKVKNLDMLLAAVCSALRSEAALAALCLWLLMLRDVDHYAIGNAYAFADYLPFRLSNLDNSRWGHDIIQRHACTFDG